MDLNQPGIYLHWSIINISVANLGVILIMLVIFGLALVLPFPRYKAEEATQIIQDAKIADENDNNKMWTARVRRLFLKFLPPDKLLPDHQPAYVSSWIYIFGVATLAALGIVIISGLALAIEGPDWWHTNLLGHFFNSVHLWSVELFMAFMVIHLWGKFWMAAWRGKRTLTWITGVVAFLASIIQCFTGYLSQQNFDSQWIATNGKDAINSTGMGGFFNLMNFGQMLLWHTVIIPIGLIALVGGHILLVRIRGVSHPITLEKMHTKEEKKYLEKSYAAEWKGPSIRYDILKEGVLATIIVFILTILLAGLFSSPDLPPLTIAAWANKAPGDFMSTAASELAGTSETATYGPPYNNGTSNVQGIGLSWQRIAGVHEPINTAKTFVLSPLAKIAPTNPYLANALMEYENASPSQQQVWNKSYQNIVSQVTFVNGTPIVPLANDGPIPSLINTELTLARSGALDADLLAQQPFFGTNYTKPLMFIEDGSYFASIARQQNLSGDQWGVMNETGRYPGQPWLWLYTLWYQIPGISSSSNIDLIAIYLTGLGTLVLLAVPFLPGLRDIPYIIPIHRLIWRRWNKSKLKSPKI